MNTHNPAFTGPPPEPTRNCDPNHIGRGPDPSSGGPSVRDLDIVLLAKVWAPYGGPHAEDIFVSYGWNLRQFYARLAAALPTLPEGTLSAAQFNLLREQCIEHLGAPDTWYSRRTQRPADDTAGGPPVGGP